MDTPPSTTNKQPKPWQIVGIIFIILTVMLAITTGYLLWIKHDQKGQIDSLNTRITQLEKGQNGNGGSNQNNENIYEKLLRGDFSGVAGDFANSRGDTITILSNGNITRGNAIAKVGTVEPCEGSENAGAYCWSTGFSDEYPYGGGMAIIYPTGVKVWGSDGYLDGDTSKTRFTYSGGGPTAEDVYYRK